MEARGVSAGEEGGSSGGWALAKTANHSAAQETTGSLYANFIGLFAERRLERDVASNRPGGCRDWNLHV